MYIVDRIVENKMLCETINNEYSEIVTFEKVEGIKEGDIVRKVDNKFIVDFEETEKRKNKIKSKLNRLKIKK